MNSILRLSIAALLALAVPSFALAQSARAPATATASGAGASAKAGAEHSEISKKCSAEADAKGLHGKERRKYRSACKHKGAAS